MDRDTVAQVVESTMAVNGQVPLRIVRLSPGDPTGWAIFPFVLGRMQRFSERHHPETNTGAMCQYVRQHWAVETNQVALWVALDGVKLVGHCLATLHHEWGTPIVMVVQTELDAGLRVPLHLRLALLSELDTWAREHGATRVKMLTIRDQAAFARHSGFTVDKVLMQREVN